MAPEERPLVPSDDFPTLSGALAAAKEGAVINVLSGYREEVEFLILDRDVEIEGPADRSATLTAHNGVVIAGAGERTAIAIRNLQIRATSAPALNITSTCTVEFCDISAPGIGVHLTAASASDQPYLGQTLIHDCDTGLCIAGHPRATLDGLRLERNSCGAVIVGLELAEGQSDGLAAFASTRFAESSVADLKLVALRVREHGSPQVHCAEEASEVLLRDWPRSPCSAIALTGGGGKAVLRVDGTRTQATLGDAVELGGSGVLPKRGTWRTGPLPVEGKKLLERRRDFMRLVAPRAAGLLTVTPEPGPPCPWRLDAAPTGGADAGAGDQTVAAEQAVAEFGSWLEGALRAVGKEMREGLVDRCVALLGAGEGVGFTIAHHLQPVLLQPRFVLLVASSGEVRVAWLAFVTDKAQPNMTSGPCIIRLLTEDLHSEGVASSCRDAGVQMHFAANLTSETDISDLVGTLWGSMCRAVNDGRWDVILSR